MALRKQKFSEVPWSRNIWMPLLIIPQLDLITLHINFYFNSIKSIEIGASHVYPDNCFNLYDYSINICGIKLINQSDLLAAFQATVLILGATKITSKEPILYMIMIDSNLSSCPN